MFARWSVLVALIHALTTLTPFPSAAADLTLLGYGGTLIDMSADGSVILVYTGSDHQLLEGGVLTPLSSLPGYPADAKALGMSDDAQVIVGNARPPGHSTFDEAFIWSGGTTTYLDLGTDGGPSARAISGDGSTVVGLGGGTSVAPALFAWSGGSFTSLESMVDAGFPGTYNSADLTGVSFDGSVVIGSNNVTTNGCFQCDWALRWNAAGDVTVLDDLLPVPPPDADTSELMESQVLSGDGLVVAGRIRAAPNEPQHFRFDASGYGVIEETSGTSSDALNDISHDGTRIAGRRWISSSDNGAGIWDPVNGFRYVANVLQAEGVSVPAGYTLTSAHLISADGRIVAGRATPPGGGVEIWIATLPAPPDVPVLTPLGGLVLAIALGACAWAVDRRRRSAGTGPAHSS